MDTIYGKINKAISFAKTIDPNAREQIQRMCDYEFTKMRRRKPPHLCVGRKAALPLYLNF